MRAASMEPAALTTDVAGKTGTAGRVSGMRNWIIEAPVGEGRAHATPVCHVCEERHTTGCVSQP